MHTPTQFEELYHGKKNSPVLGVMEGVSECLSIKTGLLYRTKLKLEPTKLDSSSRPPPESRPALSPDPFVTVDVIFVRALKNRVPKKLCKARNPTAKLTQFDGSSDTTPS